MQDLSARLQRAAAPYADKLVELGFDPANPPSPVDLLVRLMYWRLSLGDKDAPYYAGEYAAKVAPYLEARLSSTEVKGTVDERVTVQIVRFAAEEKTALQAERVPLTLEQPT